MGKTYRRDSQFSYKVKKDNRFKKSKKAKLVVDPKNNKQKHVEPLEPNEDDYVS